MSLIAGLRCTVCRSSKLVSAVNTLTCHVCGQEYPVLGGVPVMFESVFVRKEHGVDNGSARQVLAAFDLPVDSVSLLRVRTMMRKQVRFGGSLIQVESQQFLDRVRNSGHEIAGFAEKPAAAATGRDLSVVPRYGWIKNYIPRRLQADTLSLANMRLENRGTATLYRSGPGRAAVALQWQHRDGTRAAAPDERTPLPIDLAPGQAVTIAVRLVAPARPGGYLLSVRLVQEQVRWLDEDSLTIPVTVEREVPGPVPDGWIVLPDPPVDYNTDHARGRAILADWLRQHALVRPRVLEVGGNAAPMIAHLDVELAPESVNVDVDLLGLQMGEMVARQRGVQIRQLCADALDLPFTVGYFDVIVIFASLHHFPDPAALLERLRRKLRPGGFIGLFCEPVGHVWSGAINATFLAELERGVNEQSFSLREYELMFFQAELEAAEVVVDKDSLKARLVHAPADELR
jgi:SAM-dependent methyltransferase/uncharacterized protein YbaR (Trm112 family)